MFKIKRLFEFILKYYFVLKYDFSTNKLNKIEPPFGFLFKILTIHDLHYFNFCEGKRSAYLEICKKRLNDPNFYCFALIHENTNELAHYSWINHSDHYLVKETSRIYHLKKNKMVLFEDDNTLPNYRGFRLHTYVLQKRLSFAKELGVTSCLIIIHPRNTIALKSATKIGFSRINFLPYYYCIGSFSYLRNKLTNYVFSFFQKSNR